MLSITELVESKGYKNFMKYVYGWGASIVLLGALFKIMHFPGAAFMLTFGLIVEALIFFFSAFEPLHEELDWTLVYPELAGLTDDFEEEEAQARRFDRANDMGAVMGAMGGAVIASGQQPSGDAVEGAPTGGHVVTYTGNSPTALSKFDEMLEKAEIGPEIFDKLGEGLNKLSVTAEKLADISDAGEATKTFTAKMDKASQSIEQLDETYQKSGEVLKESVGTLSETYSQSAQTFNQTNEKLVDAYSSFANKLTEEINTIGSEGSSYADKLGALNNNLSNLNAVYELQNQNINEHVETSKSYFNGLSNMVDNINQTVDNTQKLNKGVEQLEQNITSLNNIYGNMLSSINFNK